MIVEETPLDSNPTLSAIDLAGRRHRLRAARFCPQLSPISRSASLGEPANGTVFAHHSGPPPKCLRHGRLSHLSFVWSDRGFFSSKWL